jgi:hypothetical protein
MKFLAMTIATLSLATVIPAAASVGSRVADASQSADVSVTRKPAEMMFAQRRGKKCQENLGYGRTGSYGCG